MQGSGVWYRQHLQIELVQIQVAYIHGSYLHKKDSFGKVIWDIFTLQDLSPFSCEFQVLNISKEMQEGFFLHLM